MSDEKKPGREIDVLIAEKVMGITEAKWCEQCWVEIFDCQCRQGKHGPLPYSTDIAAAWEVLEKVRPSHGEVWIGRSDTETTMRWKCSIQHDTSTYEAIADTAPLAICLAALKAVDA
jgi:hypothetical protein